MLLRITLVVSLLNSVLLMGMQSTIENFNCKKCDSNCESKQGQIYHMHNTHMMCAFCDNREYTSPDNLTIHVHSHHDTSGICCYNCNPPRPFDLVENLNNHQTDNHYTFTSRGKKIVHYYCYLCHKDGFHNLKAISKHYKKYSKGEHREYYKKIYNERKIKKNLNLVNNSSTLNLLMCGFCNKKYNSSNNFAIHVHTKHEDMCNICCYNCNPPEPFDSIESLSNHQADSHYAFTSSGKKLVHYYCYLCHQNGFCDKEEILVHYNSYSKEGRKEYNKKIYDKKRQIKENEQTIDQWVDSVLGISK